MKKILIIVLILVLVGCQESNKVLKTENQKKDTNMKTMSMEEQIESLKKMISKKEKVTIEDYYLLLSEEYFTSCDFHSNQPYKDNNLKIGRESFIIDKDEKNGYIKAIVRNKAELQVALFTYKEKKIVVAILGSPLWQCFKMGFYSPKNDYTLQEEKINFPEIPMNNQNNLAYRLPKIGTTISVVDLNTQKILHLIEWKDGEFVLKEK